MEEGSEALQCLGLDLSTHINVSYNLGTDCKTKLLSV